MAEEKQLASGTMVFPLLLLGTGVLGLLWFLSAPALFQDSGKNLDDGNRILMIYVFSIWTLGAIAATFLARRQLIQQRLEREARSKSELDLMASDIAALKEEIEILKSGRSGAPAPADRGNDGPGDE